MVKFNGIVDLGVIYWIKDNGIEYFQEISWKSAIFLAI